MGTRIWASKNANYGMMYLMRREALENQVKALISQEGEKREGNKVIKKYYEVYYEAVSYTHLTLPTKA